MTFKDKKIVVTGAGGGIGQEVAKRLSIEGAYVIAVDINDQGLSDTKDLIKGESIKTYHLDITDDLNVQKFYDDIINDESFIDGIINVAGIMHPFLDVKDISSKDVNRVMNVNYYGTLNMIQQFLPMLKERPESILANVSSMGGLIPVPGQTIYGASKAAVKLLTEGLDVELKDTTVHVSLIIPGGVKTSITKHIGYDMEITKGSLVDKFLLTPERCAKIIVRGIKRRRFRILAGKDVKIMDFLYRMTPRLAALMMRKMIKHMMQKH